MITTYMTDAKISGRNSFQSTGQPKSLPDAGEIYDDGLLRVEHENYYASCGGKTLDLRRASFLILSVLVRHPERVVPFETIWNHIWNGERPLNVESLKVQIYNLRQKLQPYGIKIKTMMSVGYKFVPPAEK